MQLAAFTRRGTLVGVGIAVLIAAAVVWAAGGGNPSADSVYGPPPVFPVANATPRHVPELIGAAKDWINTDGKTIHIYGPDHQPDKVYLIDFWDYTCVNCLRTLPYLESWDKKYRKDGLVIIGIHSPEFRFAHSAQNVRDAVRRLGIKYPVLIDSAYKNWTAYDNHSWPHDFVVDDSGLILEQHIGEGRYGLTEKEIRKALLAVHPKLKFGPLTPLVHDSDVPGAVCYPMTPELYCGYERGQLANEIGYQQDKSAMYHDPTPHQHADGQVTLNGQWSARPQYIQSVDIDAKTYVAIQYHALDANAVIRPADKAAKDKKDDAGKNPHHGDHAAVAEPKATAIHVLILQDGKPVAKQDAGADIHYDAQGQSYLLVDQPRMYYIIHNHQFGYHELKLIPQSKEFQLYSFSFSSCTE